MKEFKHGGILIILSIPILIISAMFVIREIENTQTIYYYDFEDDKTGSYPKGFIGVLRDTDYTRVVYFDEIHKNVVEINYFEEPSYNPVIGGGLEFNTIFRLTKRGIIEFDIYIIYNKRINIDICQTDGEYDIIDDIVIRMPFSSTQHHIAIMNEEGVYEEIKSFSISRWYKFKIEFDVDIGWALWIDGALQSSRIGFYQDPPYMCQLYFATYELGQVFYVDNIMINILEEY